ncbi:MAG: hypothetical protein RL617_718 [Pseudomonadota bacterium]
MPRRTEPKLARRWIEISIEDQRLRLFESPDAEPEGASGSKVTLLKDYSISSSKNGVGQELGSYKTPLGRHVIRAKIGDGAPLHSVFVRRLPTGEVWSPELANHYGERDWILTRILWLCGRERGHNRFGSVDTMKRYIYSMAARPRQRWANPDQSGAFECAARISLNSLTSCRRGPRSRSALLDFGLGLEGLLKFTKASAL